MEKEYKYGIAALKIILSYAVIVDHYVGNEMVQLVQKTIGNWAVPCFMLISFYLLAHFNKKYSTKIFINRIKRLYFPMILWGGIIWCVNVYVLQSHLTVDMVFKHLLLGSEKNMAPQMWFNMVQIWLLLTIWILNRLHSNKVINLLLLFLFVLCFVLQYSGINYRLFQDADVCIGYSIGRVAELLPYACIGYIYGIYENTIKRQARWIILGILFVGSIFLRDDTIGGGYGFGYCGLNTLFVSLLICFVAINIKIKKNKFSDGLLTVSGFCGGIYYIHYMIKKCLIYFGTQLGINYGEGTLLFGLYIWIICFVLLIPIKLLSKKFKFFAYFL